MFNLATTTTTTDGFATAFLRLILLGFTDVISLPRPTDRHDHPLHVTLCKPIRFSSLLLACVHYGGEGNLFGKRCGISFVANPPSSNRGSNTNQGEAIQFPVKCDPGVFLLDKLYLIELFGQVQPCLLDLDINLTSQVTKKDIQRYLLALGCAYEQHWPAHAHAGDPAERYPFLQINAPSRGLHRFWMQHYELETDPELHRYQMRWEREAVLGAQQDWDGESDVESEDRPRTVQKTDQTTTCKTSGTMVWEMQYRYRRWHHHLHNLGRLGTTISAPVSPSSYPGQ